MVEKFGQSAGEELFELDTKQREDSFLAIAAVAAGVDADSREFTAFTPALDSQLADTEEVSDFGNS